MDGSLDFERLGEAYRLSGGQIRNIVFKAAFRAARTSSPLTMALLEGVADEETSTNEKAMVGFVG